MGSTGPSRAELQQFLNRSTSLTAPRDLSGSQFRAAEGTLSSSHQQQQANESDVAQQFQQNLQGYVGDQPDPFSPAWYADHPNAWQSTHPYADAWAVATWGALNVWVSGYNASPNPYLVSGGTYTSVSTYDVPTVEPEVTTSEPPANPEDRQAGEWLPLGVFGLVDATGRTTPMVLQLAISRAGILAGTYFNADSDATQQLTGQLNPTTQVVSWTVSDNPTVVFETQLVGLTQTQSDVAIRFGSDVSETWHLVRLDAPSKATSTVPVAH